MESIIGALGPLFLLILLGALLGRGPWPGGDFWARLEGLIYYLLFPAMLVATLAEADIRAVPVARLALVLLGSLLLLAVGLWTLRPRLGLDMPAFTSVFQGALRFNTYVGVARRRRPARLGRRHRGGGRRGADGARWSTCCAC